MSEARMEMEDGPEGHPHLVRRCTKDRVVLIVELTSANFDASFVVSAILDVRMLEGRV
jgi:hypothetical protein